MVSHASGRFRRMDISSGHLEEIQYGLVFERRRVRDIHNNGSAGKCLSQPFTGKRVDARGTGCGYDIVAFLAQHLDELRADEPASADNDNLHRESPGKWTALANCRVSAGRGPNYNSYLRWRRLMSLLPQQNSCTTPERGGQN